MQKKRGVWRVGVLAAGLAVSPVSQDAAQPQRLMPQHEVTLDGWGRGVPTVSGMVVCPPTGELRNVWGPEPQPEPPPDDPGGCFWGYWMRL